MTPEQRAGRTAFRQRVIAAADMALEKSTRLGRERTQMGVHRRDYKRESVSRTCRPLACTFVKQESEMFVRVEVDTEALREYLANYEEWADRVGA